MESEMTAGGERTMQTRIAKGTRGTEKSRHNVDTRQIAIRFEGDLFEKIALKAQAAGVSFAEQVRVLVGHGLDREQSDAEKA
jgi:hypothetical protein